jgi:hypothetical protein
VNHVLIRKGKGENSMASEKVRVAVLVVCIGYAAYRVQQYAADVLHRQEPLRQAGGVVKAAKLHVHRLEEEVQKARTRQETAKDRALIAWKRVHQARLAGEALLLKKEHIVDRFSDQAKVQAVREDVYYSMAQYETETAGQLAAMGVPHSSQISMLGDRRTEGMIALEMARKESLRELARLDHDLRSAVDEFEKAKLELDVAVKEIEVADAEVRQRQTELEIAKTGSVAGG